MAESEAAAADFDGDHLRGTLGAVGEHEREMAAPSGAEHLPGESRRAVKLDEFGHSGLHHGGEERNLGGERCSKSCGESLQVASHDSVPAARGRRGKRRHLGGCNILPFDHGASRAARKHRDEHQMVLQPGENGLVVARLDALGPVAAVIVVARKARHADADGVLGAGNVPLVLRGVLKAEEQTGEHLLIVVGQLVGPYLAGGIARGGRHSATLHEFHCRLDGYSERPAGTKLRYVGLVDPRACQVYAVREMRFHPLAERSGGAGLQSGVGHALKLDVLDAAVGAEAAFHVAAAVGVDHEDVGLHQIERIEKVEHAAAVVDVGIGDVADGLDHIEALLLGVDGLAVFQLLDGAVGAYAHVEVAVARGLLEEGHMARMEHVVAAGNEYFLVHYMIIRTLRTHKPCVPTILVIVFADGGG